MRIRNWPRAWFAGLLMGLFCAPIAAQAPVSPAEQKIAWARKAIETNPKRAQPYNDLAFALARRARETANPDFYVQADQALMTSLALEPDNFEALKVRAWILLGRHEFARALEIARTLNRRMPDDLQVYGLLADANAELGRYDEAETAAQWMLDLRPGNVPGLTRAAYLRELFGDVEGAVELMASAYDRTPPAEIEDRAWILTQVAHLQLMTGRIDEADKLLQQALILFPSYHYALANLAKVRAAQDRAMEAADLLRQRYRAAPHPENLYDVAVALARAGRVEDARRAFMDFERQARAEMAAADNANRELIFYYADHSRKPDEALRVARLEIARRQDVFTLDAYAWALHSAGQSAEARTQIEKALAVGIREARILYHAGVIAAKLNDGPSAKKYLQQSLELSPRSEVADQARKALARVR